MKRFSVPGLSGSATANHTAAAVTGSATIRSIIYHWEAGVPTTPIVDTPYTLIIQPYTAAGTSTAVTPQPLDAAEFVAICTAGQTHTVEPTYSGGSMYTIILNWRATYQWTAQPYGELIGKAASANGIGLYLSTVASACTVQATIHYWE
jgi:hypothetical protein